MNGVDDRRSAEGRWRRGRSKNGRGRRKESADIYLMEMDVGAGVYAKWDGGSWPEIW
jgi:hypothetical protein